MNGMTKLHVGVKDGLGENWLHRSALIAGRLVLKSTLVSRRRQMKVVDKEASFVTTMISQGILRGVSKLCGIVGPHFPCYITTT